MTKIEPDELCVHHFSDTGYAKEYRIAAGGSIVQHRHNSSHLSILASGEVLLHVDGETTQLQGPACITIEAGKHHAIKALTDTVWFCVHSGDDDHALIMDRDYPSAQKAADALGLGVLP